MNPDMLQDTRELVLKGANIFGHEAHDRGSDVAIDKDGNFYVAGVFQTTVKFGPSTSNSQSSKGGYDHFLVRADKNGMYTWSVQIGGSAQERHPPRIAVDKRDGSVVMMGTFRSMNTKVGNNVFTPDGGTDVYLLKMNSGGIPQWSVQLRGTSEEYALDLAIDSQGNIVIAMGGDSPGQSVSIPGGGTLISQTDGDLFLVVFDERGAFVSKRSKRFGRIYWITGDENRFALAVDSKDNILLTGSFNSLVKPPDFGKGPLSYNGSLSDIFVVKLNKDLDHLWSNAYGGPGNDYTTDIAIDLRSDEILVLGHFEQQAKFADDPYVSKGGADVFLARYSQDGRPLGSIQFGDTGNDLGGSVAIDPFGNLFITGSFEKTAAFPGGSALNNNGLADVFVAKLEWTAGQMVHRWSKSFGSAGVDYGRAIAIDGNYNLVTTGHVTVGSAMSINFGGGNVRQGLGGEDIFILQLGLPGAPGGIP